MSYEPLNWLVFDGKSTEVAMEPRWKGLKEVTVEAWVRSEGEGGHYLGLAPPHARDPVTHYPCNTGTIFVKGPSLYVGIGYGNEIAPCFFPPNLPAPGWSFLVVTFSGLSYLMPGTGYVIETPGGPASLVGKFIYRLPQTLTLVSDWHRLWLGRNGYGGDGRFFQGDLSQVAIWSGERSESQIVADSAGIVPDRSLLGWWPLNEGSGTRVLDHSGNGLHGTIRGAHVRDGESGDEHWATNKVVIQVTRNPRQPHANQQDSYIFPGMPTVKGGVKFKGDPVWVHPGDEVHWRFTDPNVDSDSVTTDPESPKGSEFWSGGVAPHEVSGNPREWVATVAANGARDDEYDFDVRITEGGVHDVIDPPMKNMGRGREKMQGT